MHVSLVSICGNTVVTQIKQSFGLVITSSSSPTQSTPLPTRLIERRASLTSEDRCLETCDLELSTRDLPHVRISTSVWGATFLNTTAPSGHLTCIFSAGATSVSWEKKGLFLTTAVPQGDDHLCPPGEEPSMCNVSVCTMSTEKTCFHVTWYIFFLTMALTFHRHPSRGSSPLVMGWGLAPLPRLRDRRSLHPLPGESSLLHSFRTSIQ